MHNNEYIRAQIVNMTAIVKTFETSCKMAAIKDDGHIDQKEEKQLKKINAACKKFMQELNKVT